MNKCPKSGVCKNYNNRFLRKRGCNADKVCRFFDVTEKVVVSPGRSSAQTGPMAQGAAPAWLTRSHNRAEIDGRRKLRCY